jgi:hypothetical protein
MLVVAFYLKKKSYRGLEEVDRLDTSRNFLGLHETEAKQQVCG